MPKVEGILHFTIPVKDLDRSEKFYAETLGFSKIGRTDRIVFMRAGDDFFNLTFSENPITQNAAGRHEIHSAFRVTPEVYDETLKSLPAKGVEIFKEEDRRAGVSSSSSISSARPARRRSTQQKKPEAIHG